MILEALSVVAMAGAMCLLIIAGLLWLIDEFERRG